ncbi:hypothetical protein BA059_05270 [Mycolicibacterium sp. (ex Dasyatis americana)]|uniref:Antitoxin VbhA domain-containing protein n=1 Tax=Mycolicibacterium fortuitum subsp. acetamidolyticum TaxID=144550 RepID=A0A100WQS2_MYCFO|nr:MULTISPECIES: antitoxin VbhA family protein [Mycolicibacterium]OFB42460.1 hypothetical protein BA059_05270 [Mycolicibacterium sp. (ex Dasyatis americana)]MCV7137833.1 antitoxin VbhA family protein [Mycolicibacterium fortuitum]OBK04307.1 hypothetical protein A5637_02035 [Mycolicibacterium fortuitum]OBK68776.1 hypothetical protein A5654_13995 [Mycolicibacterium fortuitum]UBV12776.1 antitoxin VbhA family protein [Mycolicibacterium fortuitum]
MSGETAGHELVDLANLAELLHNSGLSSKDQQAVRAAVVDSVLEGATPDRDFVRRLIELAAGRITIGEYKSQVLEATNAAGRTVSGEELRARHGATSAPPPRRRFGQPPDLVVPDNFDDPLLYPENPAQEGDPAT